MISEYPMIRDRFKEVIERFERLNSLDLHMMLFVATVMKIREHEKSIEIGKEKFQKAMREGGKQTKMENGYREYF